MPRILTACFLLGLSLVNVCGVGLETVWVRYYDAGRTNYPNFDSARALALDAGGNVYVTGSSARTNYSEEAVTLKYDPSGNLLWEAHWSSAVTNADRPVQLLIDSRTNVYVLGYSAIEGKLLDVFLLKYSSAGDLIFAQHRGIPYWSALTLGQMALDADDSLYVTGTMAAANGLPVVRTTKQNPAGETLWTAENASGQSIHFGPRLQIESNAVVLTGSSFDGIMRLVYSKDGQLLASSAFGFEFDFGFDGTARLWFSLRDGGIVVLSGNGCGSSPPFRGWQMARRHPDGSHFWTSFYAGNTFIHYVDSFAEDAHGAVYVTGPACSQWICEEGYYFNVMLLKYDGLTGERLWGHSASVPRRWDGERGKIRTDADGNVFVGTAAYLLKCDPNGNRLWMSSNGCEEMADFLLGPEGDLYVAGYAHRFGSGGDYVIARYRQPATTGLPVLSAPLPSQAVPSNGVLRLTAAPIGTQPIGYQWWVETALPTRRVGTGPELVLTNPRSGQYFVVMSNSIGSVTSAWARISRSPKLTNPSLSADGLLSFYITGEADGYAVEASADLETWDVLTNLFVCGAVWFTNAVVRSPTTRFLRVRHAL